MAKNKSKIDQLHDLLPSHLNTKGNTNWKALIEALGAADNDTADLVTEVRKQFFVKTASRPYLDTLGANVKINRPKVINMSDVSYRKYIPVLSYQPKQVKLIIDQLLDIFFFKESTTAYITSELAEPFNLTNGWDLRWIVDEQYQERAVFNTSDFTDINNASANEIVATINRQSKYSYATSFYDSITKLTYIRLFSNTVGSKGSLRISGGQANLGLHFNGFIANAGNGADTQWTVTKIGDEATFRHVAGISPNINQVQVGDLAIINLPNNSGSFTITKIDLANNSFSFINLFAAPGTYTQLSDRDVKFLRPDKFTAFLNPRHAMTWETKQGEFVVEMPTSPPIVKRSLKGSSHINGAFSNMNTRDSDTSLTVMGALTFPESGTFLLEEVNELQSRLLTPTENILSSKFFNSRLGLNSKRYEYTSRLALATTGDFLEGTKQITNLASTAGLSIGQQIIVDGFPPYTQVLNILGNLVNVSAESTKASNGASIKFLGNTLTGITPNLPILASLNEYSLASLNRNSNTITGTTSAPHNYVAGETIVISGALDMTNFTAFGNLTSGSNTITGLSSMAGIVIGMSLVAVGIPANTVILSLGANSLVMSKNATATGITTVQFNEVLNGGYTLLSASGSSFTFSSVGPNGSVGAGGNTRVERIGLANSGSKVFITDAISNQVSRITGSYMWDLSAAFTLSSNIGRTSEAIKAGKIIRLLNTDSNTIPESGGSVVFDYGRDNQEGPIRYLYKPTDNTIALDPSYTFKYNHIVGSPLVHVARKGPVVMSGKANEYPAYITDPSEARIILQDLIKSVKSAGIFVNFLVRFPEQLYGVYDVYNQNGNGAGQPF